MAGHPPRGRPPPSPVARSPHRACKPRGQCWAPTPAHPRPQHVGDGPRQPSRRAGTWERGGAWPQTLLRMVKASPPGTPFLHPHSAQRQLARARAVGPVLGPHNRTDRTRGIRVAEPRLPTPEGGRPRGGTAPDTRRHSQRWEATRERPPTTPAARSPHRGCKPRGQCWAPTPAHRAHSTWVADPDSPDGGRAVGGGEAPDLRRPSQR